MRNEIHVLNELNVMLSICRIYILLSEQDTHLMQVMGSMFFTKHLVVLTFPGLCVYE